MPTIRVYSGERRKKGVVLGGDVPLGRAPGQPPKSQVMLYMNIEVITSIRLWVRCPSHSYTVLLPGCLIRLQIASLGHAAGILWMAKPIRQICCSYLWGRPQYSSIEVSQYNIIKTPLTAEIHLFQGRDLSILHIRATYKNFKSWLSRPARSTFLLIFYDSSLNI